MKEFSNRKILNNTIILYVRLCLIMFITLFTSRIILNELGFVDFGIFTLLSGFVVIFGFFGSSLSNAAQRFMSIQYGLHNLLEVQKVISLARLNFFILSILVVLVLETLGLWMLNSRLEIPFNRIETSNYVFHLLTISVFFTINGYTYFALLLAKENMRIFALIGIVESVLRLVIAFSLVFFSSDKLALYSLLYVGITIVVTILQVMYCHLKYEECTFKFFWDKVLFKEMYSFIGWNSLIALVEAINQQGIGVVLNLFFGPIINAARGISFQISNALGAFSHNIYMASRPQLIKAYAQQEYLQMTRIIVLSSKSSFYLLLIISLPVLFNLDYILKGWLVNIPEHTLEFSVLIILYCIVDSIKNPFWATAQATGNLKRYSILGSFVFSLNFPISYILLMFDFPPVIVYYSYLIVRVIYLIFTIRTIKELVPEINLRTFTSEALIPMLKVALIAPFLPILVYLLDFSGFLQMVVISAVSILSALATIYYIGLSEVERFKVVNLVKSKFQRG